MFSPAQKKVFAVCASCKQDVQQACSVCMFYVRLTFFLLLIIIGWNMISFVLYQSENKTTPRRRPLPRPSENDLRSNTGSALVQETSHTTNRLVSASFRNYWRALHVSTFPLLSPNYLLKFLMANQRCLSTRRQHPSTATLSATISNPLQWLCNFIHRAIKYSIVSFIQNCITISSLFSYFARARMIQITTSTVISALLIVLSTTMLLTQLHKTGSF